jgi:PAT family beta-lactamase induction signal transducer AmpG
VKDNKSLFQVLQSRKMAALLFLGFSSGLPLYLASKTPLQAWMTKEGVSLSAISAFSLVGLPYSLKFLWSPLVDRFVPPFLGRRRGWMVITQVALLLAIAAMALQKPSQALQFLAINALIVAFFSATQDIVIDAYRTDVLEKREIGPGASIFLLGYRISLIVTSALALFLADRMPWPVVYVLMSLLMAVGLISSILAPEPVERVRPPANLLDAVRLPFIDFFQRRGLLQGALILIFIVIYKLGDGLVKNISTPFLLDKGLNFSQTDLAFPGALGIFATIVGTLAGGAIMSKIGINRSLWIFAVMQAIGNLFYFALALVGKNYLLMLAAINMESFCAGLESAAFVAFMMSLCNQSFSATQYALLSSLVAFSRDILVAPAGQWAEALGWSSFFLLTAIAALPGLLLLPFFAPWNPRPAMAMPRPGLDDEEP